MPLVTKECRTCRGKGQIQRIVGREIKIDICPHCRGKGTIIIDEAKAETPPKDTVDLQSVPFLFDEILAFPIADETQEIVTTVPMDQKMEKVMTTVSHIKEEKAVMQPTELETKYLELIDQLKQYIVSTKDLDNLLETIETCQTLPQIKKTVGHLQRWQTFSLQVVLWMQKTEKTWDKLSGGAETPLRSEWIQLKRQLLQTLDTKKEQIEARIGERSALIIDASIENTIRRMTPNSEIPITELAKSVGGEVITIEKRLLYLLYNKDMDAIYDSVRRKLTKQ